MHSLRIERTERFKRQFREIIFYIAKDKKSASKNFKDTLDKAIDEIRSFPYKYRKSIYFDNENIRDMIFRGYTIVYEIFDDKIEIITIFNQNKPPYLGNNAQ